MSISQSGSSLFRGLIILGTIISIGASGCAADTEPDEETGASDEALSQGGCSTAEIRSRQALCRDTTCPNQGKKSRGITVCKHDYYTFEKDHLYAPCVCR